MYDLGYQASEFVVINSHRRNEVASEQTIILLDESNRPLHLKLYFS